MSRKRETSGGRPDAARRVRILVVDDSRRFRESLCRFVDATPGLELVAAASSGAEAIELCSALAPDMVLMDVRMDGIGGIDATRAIVSARPTTRVVVMSASMTESMAAAAAGCGAAAAVAKKDLTSQSLTQLLQLLPGRN